MSPNDHTAVSALPYFLQSFGNLTAHFDEHFDELTGNERGDQFLQLAQKIAPHTAIGRAFPLPELADKKTHDRGVDMLSAANDAGEILCVQSKFKIHQKDDIDSILSKFKDYEARAANRPPAPMLFDTATEQGEKYRFVVVTSSRIDRILSAYESSELASRDYFRRLKTQDRIVFVDGPQILRILQDLYRKANILPTNIELRATPMWLRVTDRVLLGAVRGSDLVDLYHMCGEALFFENIRDFLGTTSGKKASEDRGTVNQDILHTIGESPDKMLERNNGITFRAERIHLDNANACLRMDGAAVVNGCQTTMCLVTTPSLSNECVVQVKVVVTEDAWDIAKAANYQNAVARIDLDLARYLRPQLVRRAAATQGYSVEVTEPSSAMSVLNAVHRHSVDYEELRCLYLGLFSRKPNNLFEGNYTELRADVLESLNQESDGEAGVFSTLFLLLKESRVMLETCRQVYTSEDYAPLFKRFFHHEKPRYRAYLAILTICGALGVDIANRDPTAEPESSRMRDFFTKVRALLEGDKQKFKRCYLLAFATLADTALEGSSAGSESEVAQMMFQRISSSPFKSLYLKLLVRMDTDRALSRE